MGILEVEIEYKKINAELSIKQLTTKSEFEHRISRIDRERSIGIEELEYGFDKQRRRLFDKLEHDIVKLERHTDNLMRNCETDEQKREIILQFEHESKSLHDQSENEI